MTTKDPIVIKTVEELANFAVAKLHYSVTKFELRDSSERVWDDPEAGKAWLAEEYHEFQMTRVVFETDEERTVWKEELQIRRPEEHTVETWWLSEKSKYYGYSDLIIHLSTELGHLLNGIWKQVPYYRGATYTHRDLHGLTIVGMLKRLGETGVGAQIKQAIAAAEAKALINRKHNIAECVTDKAREILYDADPDGLLEMDFSNTTIGELVYHLTNRFPAADQTDNIDRVSEKTREPLQSLIAGGTTGEGVKIPSALSAILTA